MKKLVVDQQLCNGCGICETTCSQAFYKVNDRKKSAIRVSSGENSRFKVLICNQCGECMDMCARMALKRDQNGIVRLDKKKCVGCLICVAECLSQRMHYHDELATPFKCVACGLCVKQCPQNALSIADIAEDIREVCNNG